MPDLIPPPTQPPDFGEVPPPPSEPPDSPPPTAAPTVFVEPDAETSLLGAVLVNSEHVGLLADAVHLFGRRNGLIAQAMLDLAASSLDPGDAVLLRKQLGWRFDEAGGRAYLAHLVSGVPKSSNAPYYLSQLRAERWRVTAARAAQAAADALAGGDPVSTAADLLDAAQADLAAMAPQREPLEALDLVSILRDPPIDPPWILPKWLAKRDRVICAAQAGFGKSYVLLDLALALTTGQPFLGIDLIGGPQRVTIIDEENAAEQDSRRLQHLMRGRDIDLRAAAGLQLRCIVGQNVRFHREALDFLRRELDDHPTDWLFLDSLIRFIGGRDESASHDMSAWFSEALDPIKRDYDVGILVLAHTRKPGQGAFHGGGDPLHAVRGSGDIGAWPDAVWSGIRDGKARTLQVSKSRWCPEGAILSLALEEGAADGLDDGATRLVATEQDISADEFVLRRLSMSCEQGLLRSDLVEDYAETTKCTMDSAKRSVGRSLARLRGRGTVVDRQEGRAKRLFLAGNMPGPRPAQEPVPEPPS